VSQAAREAFGNTGGLPQPDVWSLDNPILYTLIWVVVILAVFVPLSVRQYKKAAR
jgi:ABC-2 type transport system permease protein